MSPGTGVKMSVIEFRLLGPLEVWRDGRQLAVGGAKPRALLAILLLRAGRVVPTDELIDALWDEHPPERAANALQAHVSALRRALEPERARGDVARVVVTRSPGYLLPLDGHVLDLVRFEQLLGQARAAMDKDPALAAERFSEALGLWRGPALADFAYESFASADVARLEEMRLSAVEDRLECELALGRHVEAAAELEGLVAEHPLRERLAGQLMLALYRCGRQADASRVFQSTRQALVDGIGMEPGPPLRALLQRVLEHDPALEFLDEGAAPKDLHNLPVELTSFVGRERELAEVSTLLSRNRLVTLTGAGGSGKTRLALRVARQALPDYRDGVWLVELAPLTDPALVASAITAAVGIRAQAGSLLQALRRSLHKMRLLIVLDNCEHLVEACAELVHELLSTCERVTILATSRQPLGLASEVSWPIAGLELPSADTPLSAGELGSCAAVRLFTERASAARAGFCLDSATADSVTRICRRLDGIPLAIELAAARTRALNPTDILQRLDHRFELLTGGGRDAMARHQTLRATVDWSHELLTESEHVLFRRLSVFAGGWTLPDSESVCADDALQANEVFEVLSELVAKSLVAAEPHLAGMTRYGMLETLRDYAAERLRAAGERESLGRRHLAHFLELAEDAHERRQTTGIEVELEAINGHQDNIRAALGFARIADPDGMLRLAAASEQLWLAGNITEGRRWLDEALASASERAHHRVRALNTAAALAQLQQAPEIARRLVDESLELATQLGDETGEAWSWLWRGWVELNLDPPRSDAARRSLELQEQLGDRLGVCHSLVFLGVVLTQRAETMREGQDALRRAVAIAEELKDPWGEGFARLFLGWAEIFLGTPELAVTQLDRAVGTKALGPIRGTGVEALARLALEEDPRRAVRLVGACAAIREAGGGRPPAWLERRGQAVRAEAEHTLGAEETQRIWEEGRRMSPEQAIAYALDHDAAPTA
ncbi:MAG: winged helix-turn-helix domain-containing protein [Solirubrobacterales bacterium]|nr:winged helix-turn-helix domain-containing protein [Solirubrobacterales bacterium]